MIPFLAGAATVVAFAPVGVYPLTLVTFALLAWRWSEASPRRCFMAGFWFGLGFFAAGVSWVYVSMSEFGGMPPPLAAFATAFFCAFLALFPATAGWLQARIPAPAAKKPTPNQNPAMKHWRGDASLQRWASNAKVMRATG